MKNLLIVSEEDVQERVNIHDAITAMEKGLLAEANHQAETLPKHVLPYDHGERALHVLGAVAPGLGISGVKTWVQHGANAHPVLMIFNSVTTQPLALIEANVLSNLRTGALAGVATKYLARASADTLGIIGSGKQARTLAQAVAVVRPLSAITVWSPSESSRLSFADDIGAMLGLPVRAVSSAEEALAGASIVGLAARVPAPVITSAMLKPGAHINSIGTTVSGKSELPVQVFDRFTTIAADSVASVRASSDEFRQFFGDNGNWESVQPLARIVQQQPVRGLEADLSLYKGMGTGVADLALAAFILEKSGLLHG